MAKIEKTLEIQVTPINIQSLKLTLKAMEGSTLLMNKYSDKDKELMTKKQTGQTTEKKKIRNLDQEVEDKKHYTNDGKIGFPASAFKSSFVEASVYMEGMNKKLASSIQIMGGIIPLKYKKEQVNKAVTIDSGMNKAPRETWRPEFVDWSVELDIQYNASQITAQQIVELIKLAGFHIGVGAWRPYTKKSNGGNHGMYTVTS